jgi:peptidoglycan hydrolase-like protein with peptidoglycan-binding domain
MKTKFIRSGLLSIGFLSAISFATLPLMSKPVAAQTPLVIATDGNLNEYVPETAPLLARGTVTPAVRDVQLLLNELGFYYGPADSIYGPRTYSAVISFQRSRNLMANGVVGEETWEALIDADNLIAPTPISDLSQYSPEAAPVLVIGSRGSAVKDVQAFLKQKGYYTGTVDGIYGAATAAAVESFQQRYGNLNNDGVVGSHTWDVMINSARSPLAVS